MDPLTTVRFYNNTKPNLAATQKAGRPIFDDEEVIEIQHPADRHSRKVFPAHEVIESRENPDTGMLEELTYAMKYPEQYRAFKAGHAQTLEGTPIAELPFLTEAKRRELRALSIYTAETLAALDGPNLKNLGQGGRDLKNQAQAYIDAAAKNVDVATLSAKNAELSARLEAMEAVMAAQSLKLETTDELKDKKSEFEDWEDEDIKVWIADTTGKRPAGNPKHETLVQMADELYNEKKAA